MNQQIRPVAAGVIIGMVTLVFGIFWAIYLVVGHESIHKTLEAGRRAALEEKFVIGGGHGEGGEAHNVHDAKGGAKEGHSHQTMTGHHPDQSGISSPHSDDLMEAAHERLTRGHIHAMGLGTIAAALSIALSFTGASGRIKAIGSICLGAGGLFYPFSWIIMGYRTVSMGLAASQESVLPVVALSVPLVLAGIFITFFSFVKGIFRK